MVCRYKGKSLTIQPDFLKGPVVCRTVYEDMHLKDLLGSILQEWYRIAVPDYYLLYLLSNHCTDFDEIWLIYAFK